MHTLTWGRKIFHTANYLFLIVLSLLCIFPLVHVLSVSLSSSGAVTSGMVKFWPVDFNIKSYQFILNTPDFIHALSITAKRVILGTLVNMVLAVLIAYPLSKESRAFMFRTFYAWYFVFTILFSGGLIPWYMTIRYTGLLDSVWALVLPGAVPVFNVILLLNFFRALPKELEESSFIDGAGYVTVLWKIYIPLSLPALATISLFTVVGHWNAWFDGLILMNTPEHYPLSSYLQSVLFNINMTLVSSSSSLQSLSEVSDQTVKAAQIFLGSLPILMIYPFLQRFFVKGIVLGSVKE
ncbi:carbohydrate ABC transporter permease [Paenibacillus psychroresistens]|uniref:Carbohydrate ABC transporter permease n=1 Tax=Paenibacillus psychroresistens TaxID=1778678 RepID=A0A6B8RII3_9BACL|nr:carbohydrate ABC transporter permease [Paenibacillus psychroresistens]QGQ95158.1 carbohydrate ABC transporter permease [Paenibacillus psychroresistens]